MKKYTLILILLITSYAGLKAQDFDHALGLRFGYGYDEMNGGITYKMLASELIGLEGILGVNAKGFLGTALLEIHKPLTDIQGFYWFYGAGAHVGIIEGVDNTAQFTLGIDGILALEYHLIREWNIPLCVTLDWKPALNLLGEENFWFDDFNLSVRYTW